MSSALVLCISLLAAAPGGELPILKLDDAIQAAKENNLDLKAAQAKLAQARQTTAKVWSGYLPQLSVDGSYTRNSAEAKVSLPSAYYIRTRTPIPGMPDPAPDPPFDPNATPSTGTPLGGPTPYFLFPKSYDEMVIQEQDQFGAQVQVNQVLIAPVLWPTIRNAYLFEEIATLDVENARREILFTVAQIYYGAAGLKETIRVQRRQLEITQQHEKDAQVRLDVGAAAQVAVLRAQIDRARAEQDVKRAENAYQSAKIALAGLLDRDDQFDVEIPPEPKLPADLSKLEEAAERDRPDVAAARLGVPLAEGQRTATFFKYLPNIGLNAAYRIANVSGFTGQNDSWVVTLGLNWTLFDGGLREAELRESYARVAEADYIRRSAERGARDEVTLARLDLESATSNRVKAAEQARLAQQTAELVNLRYREGKGTYLEVEDANTTRLRAELAVLGESLSANLAALKLLKSAGAFNP